MNRKDKRELKKKDKAFQSLLKVIYGYFKDLIPKLNGVEDKRHSSYITYSTAEILFPMLIADALTIGGMRGVTESFNSDECIENFKKILGNDELEEMPHHDTINAFLKILKCEELEKIRRYMIGQIFKKRSFEQYRFKKRYWLIVVDGTGIHSFEDRHCEHCLTRTTENEKTGEKKTRYYHSVLEAKLVLGNFVFSIGTEFIENEDEKVSKQDCETKAFKRLATRLKSEYKRLPICILGDALYASEPVRTICKENKWEYLIRYKSGCSKQLWEEYQEIKAIEHNKKELTTEEQGRKIERIYEWVNEISYNEETLNIVELVETIEEENKKKAEKSFVYISSIKVSPKTVDTLIQAARLRWKIENEGFNVQKQLGYELEHVYCYDYNAMKNHYLLIQMAHIIRQIYDHSSEIAIKLQNSIKEESKRLLQSLASTLTIEELSQIQELNFQLRLE